jgi:hypothetical protein
MYLGSTSYSMNARLINRYLCERTDPKGGWPAPNSPSPKKEQI